MCRRGDFADRVHVGRAAVQMNGQDRASSRRDGALDELRIEIAGRGIDIDEDGHGAAISDRFGRGEKRVRRGDHFIVGLNAERQQSQMERRRPAAERDAMPGAAEIREFPLESLDFRAQHERRVLADAVERRQDFVPQLRVLRLQIENGNLHSAPPFRKQKTLLYAVRLHKPPLETRESQSHSPRAAPYRASRPHDTAS